MSRTRPASGPATTSTRQRRSRAEVARPPMYVTHVPLRRSSTAIGRARYHRGAAGWFFVGPGEPGARVAPMTEIPSDLVRVGDLDAAWAVRASGARLDAVRKAGRRLRERVLASGTAR